MPKVKLGHFCDRWRALDEALKARGEPAATLGEADQFIEAYQATPAPWIAFVLIGHRKAQEGKPE